MLSNYVDFCENMESIQHDLELINSLLQLGVDTLSHHAIPDLHHLKQALQFAADKAWEQNQNAKQLAERLQHTFSQLQEVAV